MDTLLKSYKEAVQDGRLVICTHPVQVVESLIIRQAISQSDRMPPCGKPEEISSMFLPEESTKEFMLKFSKK